MLQKFFLILSALFILKVNTYDTPHFYRARFFQGEPRFEKPGLFSYDLVLSGGRTGHARNNCGETVSLLSIKNNKLTSYLTNKGDLPLEGQFSIFEAIFNGYFNIHKGFFAQIYAPLRKITIDELSFGEPCCLENFKQTLSKQKLSFKKIKKSGLSDLSTLAGWCSNYQNTTFYDYIDIELSTGVLWPIGKRHNLYSLCDVPLGYNGHFGFPFTINLSIGAFEWLTAGTYFQGIIFKDRTQSIHVKNRDKLSLNIIKSAKATVHQGPLFSTGIYLKADHLIGGFSYLICYAYDHKKRDIVRNSSTTLHESGQWSMHTLQTFFEYDFNAERSPIGLRLDLFCNAVLQGKNVFHTNMFGGQIGLDATLCF